MIEPILWSKFEASNPPCELPVSESFTDIGSPTFDTASGRWNKGMKSEAGKGVKKTSFDPADINNWTKFSLVLNIKTAYSVTAGMASDGLNHVMFSFSDNGGGSHFRDFSIYNDGSGIGWEGTGTDYYSYSDAAVAWTANVWHQIVLEVDNSRTKKVIIRIDGVEVYSSTSSATSNSLVGNAFFGIFYDSSSFAVLGGYDNPMMFGYNPDATELSWLETNESYIQSVARRRTFSIVY